MNQFIFIASIFIGLTVFSEFLIAENEESLSVVEQFSTLSLIEQKKLLADKFQKRMEFAENLFYRSEVRSEIYQNNNGVPGERIGDSFARRQFAHWQLKNDYQYNIEFFEPPKEEPLMWATANWNGQEGECKNIVKNESFGRVFGRVDTKFDPAVLPNDTYTFWLQGGSTETYSQPHYLFLHFLEHLDEWNIVVPFEDNKIQISVNFIPKSKKSPNLTGKGNISIVLDPEKNYMPVRGNIRGELVFPDGRTPWWTVEFIVQQSELKNNDIWMPVLLKTIASGSAQSHTVTVATIKITEMEQGKVTKSDVTFQFPEGTEVTDAIKGVSYKTDTNGEPIESTIQPLYGLDPSHVK
ncbi:MAG: hypothetical protein LBG58_00035, partial [Planctomycetaceae bacterium]|nr:hypothetical protein [Planctomycetaceae bacterium]